MTELQRPIPATETLAAPVLAADGARFPLVTTRARFSRLDRVREAMRKLEGRRGNNNQPDPTQA